VRTRSGSVAKQSRRDVFFHRSVFAQVGCLYTRISENLAMPGGTLVQWTVGGDLCV
jgi:hypothetical protein